MLIALGFSYFAKMKEMLYYFMLREWRWLANVHTYVDTKQPKEIKSKFFFKKLFLSVCIGSHFFFARIRRRSVQVHISLGWCMNGGGCLLMPREDLTIVWMEDKWMNSPWWWSLVSSVKCAWNWVITDSCRLLPLLCCGRGDRWLQLHSVFHNALCLGWEHWRLEKFVCFQWSK